MRIAGCAVLLILLTLGGAVARDPSLPPVKRRALLAWLMAETYRATYTPEPAVRESSTAHGRYVRAWLSPVLVEDLRTGRSVFRRGAAMVKELYFDGQLEVRGFSVMRKVRARSGRRGRGWYFYETLDGMSAIATGRGAGVCVGCHRAGTDYYLLGFQP